LVSRPRWVVVAKTPNKDRYKPIVQAIDVAGRIPPHNLDAEAAVLSAIMLDGRELDKVSFLTPEHFYSEANSRIFKAILEISGAARPIDIQTIAAWLKDREWLQAIGGVSMLARIVDATPAVAHLEAHGRIVEEKAKVRALIDTCQLTSASAYTDYGSYNELVSGHLGHVEAIGGRTVDVGPVQMFDVVKAAFEFTEKPALGTGLSSVDDILGGGFYDGEVITIAGPSGCGKTSYAVNIGSHTCSVQRADDSIVGVAIYSMEMPKEQLCQRMAASDSGVDMSAIRKRSAGGHWDDYVSSMAKMSQLPMWIDDTPSLTVSEVCGRTRVLQRKSTRPGFRLGLVIVDYIQLMNGTGDTREQEISSITRALKSMAKTLRLPVVALSSLKRKGEANMFSRTQLSDLKDSSSIEFDSDVILFPWRPEWVEFKKNPGHRIPDVEPAEITVAKQRNGRLETAHVAFEGKLTKFRMPTPMESEQWASARNGEGAQKRQRPRYNPDD